MRIWQFSAHIARQLSGFSKRFPRLASHGGRGPLKRRGLPASVSFGLYIVTGFGGFGQVLEETRERGGSGKPLRLRNPEDPTPKPRFSDSGTPIFRPGVRAPCWTDGAACA
ncbi:hypothetical protein EBL87_22380 (plasmid) [Cereibacter sphaeroides]|nr:hypothetical protein EBL87_22380 [Cereibacter sphaeroides]AZB71313.1 hypothetical protein EBL86_23445 [Cereibacter sphaeroides]